jgi:hypothetical protein
VDFTLPDLASGTQWTLLVDTNQATPGLATNPSFSPGAVYQVTGRSLLLFRQSS